MPFLETLLQLAEDLDSSGLNESFQVNKLLTAIDEIRCCIEAYDDDLEIALNDADSISDGLYETKTELESAKGKISELEDKLNRISDITY